MKQSSDNERKYLNELAKKYPNRNAVLSEIINLNEGSKRAITMGVVSIMQAKKILLIASGKEKQDNLEKAFYGPITPENPPQFFSSILILLLFIVKNKVVV